MTNSRQLKKVKNIHKKLINIEDLLFHHAVDLMLDDTPTLKKFLNKNRDLTFNLSALDFEICTNPTVVILYKLLLDVEKANNNLLQLIEAEEDDLPF